MAPLVTVRNNTTYMLPINTTIDKICFKYLFPIIKPGKNNNEIAETLNISVNTVKSLKKSAYTSLREQLKNPMLFLLFLLIG